MQNEFYTFASEFINLYRGVHPIFRMKDRIRQLMEQKGMTQKEFSRELCLAEATVSAVFNGRTRPTTAMIAAIHERFPDVSVTWLMFAEGEMYAKNPEGVIDAGSNDGELPLFVPNVPEKSVSDPVLPTQMQPTVKEVVKYIDKPQRHISEIRVFYDDGTFEVFPSK